VPQIISSASDLFTTPLIPLASLLPQQVNPSLPTAANVAAATGMLLPQPDLDRMLAHFPTEIYDLRPTSHLSRFMSVLLGDAGVGQLRRRENLARINSTLTGASFLDQDRLWGAIFSMARTLSEQLPIDPADQVATITEWDELEQADAQYRERLIALCAALPLAGTMPGILAAASAIIGAPVEASETWRLVDAGGATPTRTWGQVSALGGWGILDTQPWITIEHLFSIGLSGVNSRAEVVIRPLKTYATGRVGQITAASDTKALTEILSKLVPDGILVTVDNAVSAPGVDVPIASVWADSSRAQISPLVTVSPTIPAATAAACYPLSAQQVAADLSPTATRYLPVPYGVNTAAASWDFNAAITTTTSYAYTDTTDAGLGAPGDGTPVPGDNQTVVWRDGTASTFTPDLAVAPPSLAAASRLGSPGHLAVHPWSGSRKVVPVHA
jgi:hypothetical protein